MSITKSGGIMQEKKSKSRVRRSAEDAREEILATAEQLFLKEGPDGIRIAEISREVGISHGTLLYHFKSAEKLRAALYQRLSLRVREEALQGLDEPPGEGGLIPVFNRALKNMSLPKRGPLLAWLLAQGEDPFPAETEQGLGQIAEKLAAHTEVSLEDSRQLILLPVLAMFGECLVGTHVRKRLGLDTDESSRDGFRGWLLQVVAREVMGSKIRASQGGE